MADPETSNEQPTRDDFLDDAFFQEAGSSSEIELISTVSMEQPKSLIEERDEIRPDSPLGILDVDTPGMEIAPSSSLNHLVGPLPPLPNLTNPQPVPKLQPPPTGWIHKVKNAAQQSLLGTSELNFMPSNLFDQNDLQAQVCFICEFRSEPLG